MANKITTDKFEKFKTYLDTLNYRCEQEMANISKLHRITNKILEISDKRSKSKRVAMAEYGELAKEDCPHVLLLSALSHSEELTEDAYGKLINNCPETTCDYCWKSCIDEIVDYLNENGDICVKNIDTGRKRDK